MIEGFIYTTGFLLVFIAGLGIAEICLRFCDRLLKRKWRVRRDNRILSRIGDTGRQELSVFHKKQAGGMT